MIPPAPKNDASPMTCAAVLEKIYEFLDGELTTEVEERIRHHLAKCQRCYPHFRHEEVFLRFMEQRAQLVNAPPELRRKILKMLVHEEATRQPE